MIDTPGTRQEDGATRLRAVRFFSNLCAAGLPQSDKDDLIARVRELQSMSDAELAKLGLLREDIVDHIFRDAHFV